jgi:hypothetical protein
MKKSIRYFFTFLLLAVFLGTPLVGAHHAVLHFNLEEMSAVADRIFIGECIAVKETEEMIAKGIMPVTNYTFKISQTLKGQLPETYTFKQLGHRPRRPSGKKVEPLVGGYVADPKSYVHGMSHYQVGDQLLLMLTPQYMNGQLTYPVGLYQGAFYITPTATGKLLVKNSINNRGLFTNPYTNFRKQASTGKIINPEADRPILTSKLSAESVDRLMAKPGALPLEDLTSVLRTIVEAENR